MPDDVSSSGPQRLNPFAGLLNSMTGAIAEGMGMGVPTALVERGMQERGAMARLQTAIGREGEIRAEDRKAYEDLRRAWDDIVARNSGTDFPVGDPTVGGIIPPPAGIMTPAALQRSIQELIRHPALFRIPPQHAKTYVELLTSMAGAQGAGAFTLAPGATRFIPGAGPDGSMGTITNPAPDPVTGAAATRSVHMLETIGTEGVTHSRTLSDLTALEGAFVNIDRRGAPGWVTGLRGIAAGYGIPVEGQSDLNLAQAVAARLAPTMRTPGSGAMSDFETRSLLSALPNAWQTPAGRRYVIEQMRRIANYQVERSRIANDFFAGTPNGPNVAGAFQRLVELDNRFAAEMRSARERHSGRAVEILPGVTIRPR